MSFKHLRLALKIDAITFPQADSKAYMWLILKITEPHSTPLIPSFTFLRKRQVCAGTQVNLKEELIYLYVFHTQYHNL